MAAWSGWTGMGLVCAAALALAGCDDTTPPPAAVTSAPAAAAPAQAQAQVTGGIVLNPQEGAGGGLQLANDPSAPMNTPLCGTAAREADAIGQSLLSRQYATAGACSSFACYDPATATYLGADGYRHVCR